jgi:UDP-2-acetamido-2,6-beta-L-arabino-hexul-4-ose reductase
MYPDFAPVSLRSGIDDRGSYTELARSFEGSQVSVSTSRPGAVRGQHFHFNKVERFAVVAGTATIQIRRLLDNHVRSFDLNGDSPSFIDIPTLHTHNLINSGEGELITVFWSNDHFDPANPDTYSESVNLGTTP